MSDKDEAQAESGRVWASTHYPGNEAFSEGEIEVQTFAAGAKVARVVTKYGLTLNLGNYESARVDAGVELPCYPEEIEGAFKEAWNIAQDEIARQVEGIRKKR